jgi:hypothetical protein
VNTLKAQHFHGTIFNTLGTVVAEQETDAETGENTMTLPVLPAGLYSLQLQGETENTVLQFCSGN